MSFIKEYVFNLDPNTKPRMTQRDRWQRRPCVLKYRNYADKLRAQAKKSGYELQLPLSITFIIGMPVSWSKKKRKEMNGQPHRQNPDLDNLLKAFKDSLLDQDNFVWCYRDIEKRWGESGKIIVRVYEETLS